MRMAALRCSVSETSKAKVNSPDGEGALLGHMGGQEARMAGGPSKGAGVVTTIPGVVTTP